MSIFANYKDVHTHRLEAGPDAIINLPCEAIHNAAADHQINPESGGSLLPGHSYSVGVHPWEAAREVDWELLRRAAGHPQVVAIGEAGLDAMRGPDMGVQEAVFVRQARMAEELGKPLIVHCVRAYGRLMQLRRELAPKQPWLVHAFRGKPELARQLVAAGFELSLGDKYNPAVPAAVPAHLVHRETD